MPALFWVMGIQQGTRIGPGLKEAQTPEREAAGSKCRGKKIHSVMSGGDKPNTAKGWRFIAWLPEAGEGASAEEEM